MTVAEYPDFGSKRDRGGSGRRSTRVLLVIQACIVSVLHSPPDVNADDSAENVASAPSMSFLEGKKFAGELGEVNGDFLTDDLLVFDDGMFISRECERRCGYTAGPYWVRHADDGVRFKATTVCQRTDAVIAWEGVVRGDELKGTFTWTNKRWYWTIEKEFEFTGTLVDTDGPVVRQ